MSTKELIEHVIHHPEEWGEVGELYTGYSLLDKDGKPLKQAFRKSESYTRWFGRVMESIFSGVQITLTDLNATPYTPALVGPTGFSGANLVGAPNDNTAASPPYPGGEGQTGAFLSIGTGPLTGAHSDFIQMKTPFTTYPFNARLAVLTTQEDGVAIEFAAQLGITNNQSSTITVTEQGLFMAAHAINEGVGSVPHFTLMAYDEINPGVAVAAGQVFVPQYVLRFAA